MDLNDYQKKCRRTAFYLDSVVGMPVWVYSGLNLAGEAGEVAGLLSKVARDDSTPEKIMDVVKKLKMELGDVLYMVAALASDFDLSLDDIAEANIAKLADRQARGKLAGSGDTR